MSRQDHLTFCTRLTWFLDDEKMCDRESFAKSRDAIIELQNADAELGIEIDATDAAMFFDGL